MAVGKRYRACQPRPKKKTRAGPSVPARVCPAKTSHEGGGEHSADDPDKAIRVPTAKSPLDRQNLETGVWIRAFKSSLGHLIRIRFEPVHPGRDQLMRTRNWMVKVGFPAPAALIVPPGAIRTARTAGSKPLASGRGV